MSFNDLHIVILSLLHFRLQIEFALVPQWGIDGIVLR